MMACTHPLKTVAIAATETTTCGSDTNNTILRIDKGKREYEKKRNKSMQDKLVWFTGCNVD